MPGAADCAVDVELVDDEVRPEPPAWQSAGKEGKVHRQVSMGHKELSFIASGAAGRCKSR
jgi:hypothetical protein